MNLSPLPVQKFFSNVGLPLVGGKLFTYAAGTNTKIATYKDSGGTLNTNPIILNFRGEANVWLDPDLTYKFVLAGPFDTDPPTNPIWSVDNIAGPLTILDITQQFIGGLLWPRTAAEIAAGVTVLNFAYWPGDVRRYGAVGDGAAECAAAFQAAINQANQSTGDEILIPEGSWKISTALVGARGIKMTGMGRYRSIVVVNGAINFLTFVGTGGHPDGGSMVFRDFTVKGSSTSGNLIELTIAGQCEFHGMRFWLCGSAGGMVVLNGECHRTSFSNCLFQSWKNAAILCDGLNSIFSVQNCQFNILGGDGIAPISGSACIQLDTSDQVLIETCNTNGDGTLNHFLRVVGGLGRSRMAECYGEGLVGPNTIIDTGVVFSGVILENLNVSCASSTAIDLAPGNPAHTGLVLRNIRRPETALSFILDPGTGAIDFDYAGTPLDGSAQHVVGFTGQRIVRKFINGTYYLDSESRCTPGPWLRDNLNGTIGNTEMTAEARWVAPRAGRITGLVVKSTEARLTGTCTVNVFKNTGLSGAAGSAAGLSADLNGTNTSVATAYTQNPAVTFGAGDELYLVFSTNGWTPTTADIRAFIEVAM